MNTLLSKVGGVIDLLNHAWHRYRWLIRCTAIVLAKYSDVAAAVAPTAVHSFTCFHPVMLTTNKGNALGPIFFTTMLKDGRVLVGERSGIYQLLPGMSTLEYIGRLDIPDEFSRITELKGGRVLVQTTSGSSIVEAATKKVFRVPVEGNHVRSHMAAELADGRVLLSEETGLFQLRPGSTAWERAAPATLGMVMEVLELKDRRLLLRTDDGLLLMSPGANIPSLLAPLAYTGLVYDMIELKSRDVWIVAQKGLLRLARDKQKLQVVAADSLFGEFSTVTELTDGRLLVKAKKGLLIYSPGTEKLVPVIQAQDKQTEMLQDGRVLVGTEMGLFMLMPGSSKLEPAFPSQLTGAVQDITSLKDGRVWIVAKNGIFLFNVGMKSLQAIKPPVKIDTPHPVLEMRDGRTLFQSWDGLFLVTGTSTFERSWLVAHAGIQRELTQLQDGRVLLLADGELLLSDDDTFETAEVDFTQVPLTPSLRNPITIAIKVKSPCAEFINFWKPQLRITRSDTVSEVSEARFVKAEGGSLLYTYEFMSAGSYELQLFLRDGIVPIKVTKSVFAGDRFDLLQHTGGYALGVLTILHFSAVVGLLVGARRSAVCFRIIQDPVWSKAGVYINFLIRHWRPLQLWLLDRYVNQVREELRKSELDPYEPLPLAADDGTVRLADEGILGLLQQHHHIWIAGRAGMGKTVLVKMLEHTYFSAEGDSAFSLFRRWGRVLVFVPAHRYEAVPPDPNAPEKWVVEVITRHLAHYCLKFSDDAMVRDLLHSGVIGIVFDGVNEVGKEDQLAAFILVYARTTVLATSQTKSKEPFIAWSLPNDVQEHIGLLLSAHMGGDEGSKLETHLRTHCPDLLQSLLSGYDLRLIIELTHSRVGGVELPSSRTGLYEAIMDAIGSDYPREELSALAWQMWLAGRRELPRGDAIERRLILPLERDKVRVFRRFGQRAEFRHDQMRAYLAATWLIQQAINVDAMCVHLKDNAVWRVAARDQQEVWAFVAALLPSDLLSPAWNFAVAALERVRLQHAIQDEATKRNVPLELARLPLGESSGATN